MVLSIERNFSHFSFLVSFQESCKRSTYRKLFCVCSTDHPAPCNAQFSRVLWGKNYEYFYDKCWKGKPHTTHLRSNRRSMQTRLYYAERGKWPIFGRDFDFWNYTDRTYITSETHFTSESDEHPTWQDTRAKTFLFYSAPSTLLCHFSKNKFCIYK